MHPPEKVGKDINIYMYVYNIDAHGFSTGCIERDFHTVCPRSSDPSEKIFNIFASENEVYTIY